MAARSPAFSISRTCSSRFPRLIGRLIAFEAFAVYLVDERRGELRAAHLLGYPDREAALRIPLGQGLVGAAVATEQPLIVNDLGADPRYVELVPGMHSAVVVPLLHKSRPIGALNILSRNRGHFSDRDVGIVRQFATHVAVALVNARLYKSSRRDAEAFETLAEIGREVTSLLDLDQLFTSIAQLTKRVVDYRTFGILLLNAGGELEMKLAVQYGEKVDGAPGAARRRARGLCGAAQGSGAGVGRLAGPALHRAACPTCDPSS